MRIETLLGCILTTTTAVAIVTSNIGSDSQAATLSDPASLSFRPAATFTVQSEPPNMLAWKYPKRSAARRAHTWMNRVDARMPLVYISDVAFGAVVVFDRDGAVQGQIAGLSNPEGLFVDSAHNLWVANAGESDVLEFARGATSPSKVLADRGGFPSDVTICPDRTIYVSNTFKSNKRGGDILAYASASKNPTSSLHFPNEFQNYFLTCDVAGNVFSTLTLNPGGGAVVEYPGARQSLAMQLPIVLSNFPGGVKQDDAGNLLIADQLSFDVTEYTEAGSPTGLSIKSPNTYTVPVDIAVARGGHAVGVALFDVRQGGDSKGQTYALPGGNVIRSYQDTFNKPIGFAFDPGRKSL